MTATDIIRPANDPAGPPCHEAPTASGTFARARFLSEPVTGAEFVVRELERQGIEVVVGIPGGAILPLYDALHASALFLLK